MSLTFLLYKRSLWRSIFFFLFHLQDLQSKSKWEKPKAKTEGYNEELYWEKIKVKSRACWGVFLNSKNYYKITYSIDSPFWQNKNFNKSIFTYPLSSFKETSDYCFFTHAFNHGRALRSRVDRYPTFQNVSNTSHFTQGRYCYCTASSLANSSDYILSAGEGR